MQRILVGLASLACLACLIAWPLSFVRVYSFFYFGESQAFAVALRSGRLGLSLESGPAVAEGARRREIPPPGVWFLQSEDIGGLGWNRAGVWTSLRFEAVRETTRPHNGFTNVRRAFALPLWFVVMATAPAPAIVLRRYLIRLRRPRLGFCPSCGYDLRATPGRCPECGAVPETPPRAAA
jgi:hypothetical protein